MKMQLKITQDEKQPQLRRTNLDTLETNDTWIKSITLFDLTDCDDPLSRTRADIWPERNERPENSRKIQTRRETFEHVER